MADEIGDPMREETMSTRDHGEPDGYSTLAGGTATDIVATGPTAERRSPRRVLPLVPLRGNVPMPGMPMPISVGRPVSVAAVKAAQSGGNELVLAMQVDPSVDDPGPDHMYSFGVIGRVLRTVVDGTGSNMAVIVQALERARLIEIRRSGDHMSAILETIPCPDPVGSLEAEALVETLRSLMRKLVQLSTTGNPEVAQMVEQVESAGMVADLVAAALDLPQATRQELLETCDVLERLRKVSKLLGHQVEVVELGKKIEEQVHGQLEETKRRILLKEQLKAIRSELGEGDDPELAKLRERVESADLSAEARTTVEAELARLEALGAGSPERSWITNYLDWMLDLPWTKASPVQSDLSVARAILDRDHYGLEKPKERILESLAVQHLRPAGHAPILCFVGPPGTGKTSLAQAIAEATGRELVRISVGGVSDESEIRGHRRTYVGAMPGRIVAGMRRAGTCNPVFVIDEIDKLAASFHGDPAAALLEVLDPEQNRTFVDRYIELPLDLSQILFITTANSLERMPRPLLDRLEVIEIPSATHLEKLQIARRHLLARKLTEIGLTSEQVSFTDDALAGLIQGWTREAGVRELERQITAVLRKLALRVAQGEHGPWRIDAGDLPGLLGPQRYYDEAAERVNQPGIAMGLAWTPTGGHVLFLEAARVPGRGALKLTGQLGDVMKESAEAALSWVRSQTTRFPGAGEWDYHVHVPAGATPKDGPSAGVAMLVALASLVSDRKASSEVAMTGEITLRGQVLPVGGIREKVLGAARAGLSRVILPRRNEPDIEEVPREVRERMVFHFVDRVEEALDLALE